MEDMKMYLEQLNEIRKLTLFGAKQVLTIEDVSLLTGLKRSHLYRLTSERRIPHYKPNGKMLFFDKKEIEDWCLQNRVNTEEEAEQGAIAYTTRKEVVR